MLVKYEYGQGKCFDEILKRFHMIYGTKAVDKKTIKSWYDALKANARNSAPQSQQSPESAAPSSISRSIYSLASVRCTIKLSDWLGRYDVSFVAHALRAIDDRHLIFHIRLEYSCFYVVDTFNDDIQQVFLRLRIFLASVSVIVLGKSLLPIRKKIVLMHSVPSIFIICWR